MTSKTAILLAAVGSLYALAGPVLAADDANSEKCYGVAKAAKNDCAGAAHAYQMAAGEGGERGEHVAYQGLKGHRRCFEVVAQRPETGRHRGNAVPLVWQSGALRPVALTCPEHVGCRHCDAGINQDNAARRQAWRGCKPFANAAHAGWAADQTDRHISAQSQCEPAQVLVGSRQPP